MCDCGTLIGLKTESSSHQFVKVVEFSHTWTINNFSFCLLKPGECLTSPKFSSGASNSSQWIMELFPNGNQDEDEGSISLFLILYESNDQESVSIRYQFFLWNTKKAKFEDSLNTEFEFNATENSYDYPRWYERKFLLDPKNSLLFDDKLIIHCKVREAVKKFDVLTINSELNKEQPELKLNLAHNLELMLSERKFSDVTLLVGNEKFSVHKNILAARSPVFASMFEHDMVERSRNEVVITDFDPKVVEKMLTFIYTDEVPNLETNENMAQDLLVIADKYDLCRLKTMCEQVLCAKISADNVVEMLLFADLYKAERLKTLAITFISIHATDLIKTTPWMNMLLENSNSVAEAFAAAKKHAHTDQHGCGHSCKYLPAGPFLQPHPNVKACSKLYQNLKQSGVILIEFLIVIIGVLILLIDYWK